MYMQEPLSSALISKQKQHHKEEPKTKANPNHSAMSNNNNNRMSLPLMSLIYFLVSGGPYGQEPIVGSAGPFFAILGVIAFPILCSAPQALITAELSTAIPSNGGFVLWAHIAFGPFWAHLIGTWRFLSGVMNLASFSRICISYVKAVDPILVSSTLINYVVIFVLTFLLSLVNFVGLNAVAYASIPLGFLSLAPLLAMSLVAIPKINPKNWVWMNKEGSKIKWKCFFNSLFWSFNGWDSVSTLVGEIEAPQQTLPKALVSTLGFTSLTYLIPLLASIGAISFDPDDWEEGFYADAAKEIVGPWLKKCVILGSVLSGCGLYQAQLGSCSYQLHAMAELGLLPQFFGIKCKYFDTPWVSILVTTIAALVVSVLGLGDLRMGVNFLYSLGMLVEFGSFVVFRVRFPEIERPYKIPIDGVRGLIGMCLIPCVFVLYVIFVASFGVYVISFVMTLLGVALYFVLKIVRAKMWLEFNNNFSVVKKILDEEPMSFADTMSE